MEDVVQCARVVVPAGGNHRLGDVSLPVVEGEAVEEQQVQLWRATFAPSVEGRYGVGIGQTQRLVWRWCLGHGAPDRAHGQCLGQCWRRGQLDRRTEELAAI